MKVLLSLLLLFLSWGLRANEADSLRQRLQMRPDAAEKAQLWADLGYAFEKMGQTDSALMAYQQGFRLAAVHALPTWQGRNLRYLGMLHQQLSRYDSARVYLKRALPFFSADSLRLDRAKALVDLGNVHYHLGSMDTAVTVYLQAARLFDLLEMPPQAGIVYGNLGTLHMELSHLDEAIRYHRLNYQRARGAGLSLHAARAAYNLGGALDADGQLPLAQRYYDSALVQAQVLQDTALVGYCYLGLASLAGKRQNYHQAVADMRSARQFVQDTPTLATVLNHLGYYLGLAGKYREGEKILAQSHALCRRHGLALALRENLDFWREAAAANRQYAEAYARLMAYRELDDSLRGQDLEARLYEMEIRYETARKEQENLRLQAANADQQLRIQQMEARVRTRNLSLLLAFSLLALGAVGFFFFRRNAIQQRRIARQEASLQRQRAEQLHQEQRFVAAQAMLDGQEAERARLARELHDGLGGMLATARRMLEPASPEAHPRGLELLENSSQELRRVAHALMPGSLARFGLKAALEDLLLHPEATAKATIDLQLYGLEGSLPEKVQLAVFRIVQELLHNMNKYADANEVLVQLIREPGQLHLSYEDDGKGFDPASGGGLGLASIRRRVAYLDGSFELDAQPGKGVAVYISLPLPQTDTSKQSQ